MKLVVLIARSISKVNDKKISRGPVVVYTFYCKIFAFNYSKLLTGHFPQRRQKWGSLFRSTPKAVIVTWYWLWNFERPVFNLLFVQYVSFKRLHHATIRYSPGNFELWAGDENLSFMQWVLYKHQHHVVIQY